MAQKFEPRLELTQMWIVNFLTKFSVIEPLALIESDNTWLRSFAYDAHRKCAESRAPVVAFCHDDGSGEKQTQVF